MILPHICASNTYIKYIINIYVKIYIQNMHTKKETTIKRRK